MTSHSETHKQAFRGSQALFLNSNMAQTAKFYKLVLKIFVDEFRHRNLLLERKLFCVCWQDVSRAKLTALIPEAVVTPSAPALKDEADRKPEYPKPDTNQMIPFQPRHLAREYLDHLFKVLYLDSRLSDHQIADC